MKVLLKACARCGGDLMRSRPDSETETLTCLQCGAERDVTPGGAWRSHYARPARLLEEIADTRGEAA
jgi:hypothetical protein